jgi:hypothetical protein
MTRQVIYESSSEASEFLGTSMLEERRLAVLIRQHGVGKPKDGKAPTKLLASLPPRAKEGSWVAFW